MLQRRTSPELHIAIDIASRDIAGPSMAPAETGEPDEALRAPGLAAKASVAAS